MSQSESYKVVITLDARKFQGMTPPEFLVEALKHKVDMDNTECALNDFERDVETLSKYMPDEELAKRKDNLAKLHAAYKARYEGAFRAAIRSMESDYTVTGWDIVAD